MREIISFNTKWAFSKEATAVPQQMPEKWYWVNLPHTWNAIDGQDGGNDLYRGTAYYANILKKSELPAADLYYLEFRGANASADVYVNGKKLASHDGGYSTWRVNMTEALTGEENLVVVAVDNGVNDRVYPQNADFTFYGGLYRNVNIIAVSESHFDLDYYGGPGIKVTPEITGKDAKVEVEVFLTNAKAGQKLVYTVKDKDGKTLAEKTVSAEETKAVIDIPAVHLWNGRKDPYLYTAEVVLVEGEDALDNVSARFGCRTYQIDPERGFILNGEEYPLRGVSRHQDRWGIGNALLPEHHEEDMELICEMGATTIRLAHYQHDQYFYDLCDEKGLVIWAEIPYISSHMPTGRENTISQMKELVVQNYNHPSIVVWGLSNEITMTGASTPDLLENHNILNDMVHEMDKTRLTTMAVVSMCDIHDPYIQIPDTISYNHYFGWYGGDTSMNGPWLDNFHKEFPNIPIGMSEYGCEALNWHTSDPQQGDYTEEYQAYYHEELIKQLFSRKYLWATHVWNMFDFGADARNEGGENGQNHKGLVTFDRKYKKDSFYAYKAWLSDEPFVHICGKRYIDRVEDTTKVTVYSNLPEVELFVNGKSLGKLKAEDHFFYFQVPNAGESTLVAVAGECRDESHIRKVDTFNEEYRLKEKGAVLNWFDITAPEGYYSLNDKLSDIMKSEEGKQFFMSMLSRMMGSMGGDKKDGNPANAAMANPKMFEMLGSFTVIRMMNLMGAAGPSLTKEQMLAINEQLNKIKRVD
ncbi:MAG: glycoside hydrolase family 2 TIM barrel-domain containing protein [Clostridiales bacterium]|nr:glycoside hydrolase family 2 protein [Roseburia sp.]MDD7635783.1 glycoside hydrolase family 2 TIM barrel-domain containing protein [Clostridiales bacterium]MDY4112114.1 glycoside hydrolase family 2 TIM barrel-domain containing protein [Roseburia sp.]